MKSLGRVRGISHDVALFIGRGVILKNEVEIFFQVHFRGVATSNVEISIINDSPYKRERVNPMRRGRGTMVMRMCASVCVEMRVQILWPCGSGGGLS